MKDLASQRAIVADTVRLNKLSAICNGAERLKCLGLLGLKFAHVLVLPRFERCKEQNSRKLTSLHHQMALS